MVLWLRERGISLREVIDDEEVKERAEWIGRFEGIFESRNVVVLQSSSGYIYIHTSGDITMTLLE